MKTFLITTIAFLAITITCKAQWTGTGADISNTNTGNVGIGTTAPTLKAHIVGALGFPATSGTSQTGILRLQSSGNAVLDFSINSASGASLQTTNQTNLSLVYPLLLNPNGGKVGIGTTAPTESLTVLGNSVLGTNGSMSNFIAGTGLTNYLGIIGTQATDIPGIVLGSADGTNNKRASIVFDITNNIVKFSNTFTVGTPADWAFTGGDFAIGTSSATDRLVVQTPSAAGISRGIVINNPYAYGSGQGTAAASLTFSRDPHSTNYAPMANIVAGNEGETTATFGYMAFGTRNSAGDPTERMRITSGGKIGIGTTSPDQKLTVNGAIHSTSVLVDTNMPPADYVFNDGYHLPTLAEIKAYTEKNHHLPEVPAAAEFEKNGINLGQMNMLLLKKVEELTLYLIEKDKQLQEQKSEINQIKKQLKKIAAGKNK